MKNHGNQLIGFFALWGVVALYVGLLVSLVIRFFWGGDNLPKKLKAKHK